MWRPKLNVSEVHASETVEICDEIEVEDSIEGVGPQIELDLGQGSSIYDVEPPVKVPRVVPTVVVEEEEDSSVNVLASEENKEKDQAAETVDEHVPEAAEIGLGDQAARTVEETVHNVEKARTGAEPVLEMVEDRSGEEPDLMEVEGTVGIGEPVLEEAVEGTGAMPVRETGAGDLHFDDYLGDDFEKLREFTPEETSQTLPAPVQDQPAGTPSSTEPRKKRIKTLAGRTDLPWVQKLAALKPKPLHLPRKLHKNSLPNQPVNPTD